MIQNFILGYCILGTVVTLQAIYNPNPMLKPFWAIEGGLMNTIKGFLFWPIEETLNAGKTDGLSRNMNTIHSIALVTSSFLLYVIFSGFIHAVVSIWISNEIIILLLTYILGLIGHLVFQFISLIALFILELWFGALALMSFKITFLYSIFMISNLITYFMFTIIFLEYIQNAF